MPKKIIKPVRFQELKKLLADCDDNHSELGDCFEHQYPREQCSKKSRITRCVVWLQFTIPYDGQLYTAEKVWRFNLCSGANAERALKVLLHDTFFENGPKNYLISTPYYGGLRFTDIKDRRKTLPDAPLFGDQQLRDFITGIRCYVFVKNPMTLEHQVKLRKSIHTDSEL